MLNPNKAIKKFNPTINQKVLDHAGPALKHNQLAYLTLTTLTRLQGF